MFITIIEKKLTKRSATNRSTGTILNFDKPLTRKHSASVPTFFYKRFSLSLIYCLFL